MWMIEGVESARTKHAVHVWAYVLMPEHVHLLVWPTHRDYSISAILKTMKQAVSRRAITYVTRNTPWFLSEMADQQPSGVVTHRFWQRGGGYDSNLTEPRSVWAAMELHSWESGSAGFVRVAVGLGLVEFSGMGATRDGADADRP